MRASAHPAQSFLLSFGGEAAQSAFHFVLNLILIHLLSTYAYGIFAIIFVLGGLALAYGNAFVTVPAAVQLAGLSTTFSVCRHDVTYGSLAVGFSAVVGAGAAAGLFLATGDVSESTAGGAFIGLWAVRNHVRTSLLAQRRTSLTLVSDISYASLGFVLALLVLQSSRNSAAGVLWALVAANLAAIAIALRGNVPRIMRFWRPTIWRRYRAIWRNIAWSVVGTTTWSLQGQSLAFLVAATYGAAAYAPVAAGVVLFAPVRPMVSAFINVSRPEFATALRDGRYRSIIRSLYAMCGAIVLCCALVGIVLWWGWPLVEAYIFAGKFSEASMPLTVTLLGICSVIFLTYNIPLTLIQAAGQFRSITIATTLGAITAVSATLVLLHVTTVAVAIVGMVIGETVCGICLWLAAHRLLRRRATPGSPSSKMPVERQAPTEGIRSRPAIEAAQ